MTRKECLDEAAKCVLQDRACEYGGMEDNFGRIANLWSVYLGTKVYPVDVAMCMALLKIARIRGNKGHADSFTDLAGYAACGAECAGAAEARVQAMKDAGRECGEFRVKTFVPDFKPGDRVLALSFDETRWEEAVVERAEILSGQWHCTVRLAGGERHCLPVANVRPMPKAEGCESLVEPEGDPLAEFMGRPLVEKDAPQTPEEVCQRIVDVNPASFKAHAPTGEELAEMVKEEGHGG